MLRNDVMLRLLRNVREGSDAYNAARSLICPLRHSRGAKASGKADIKMVATSSIVRHSGSSGSACDLHSC